MNWLEVIFWSCGACVFYTYLGYPLLLALAAKLRRRPVQRTPLTPTPLPPGQRGRGDGPISIVLSAHNEAGNIERRLRELTDLLDTSGLEGEIIVVSDGSTDGTTELARSISSDRVHVVELARNQGKAAALTQGVAVARHDIVVFADARQSWAADALAQLLSNFADPQVGAVSGDLVLLEGDGVLTGVGVYWRFEKWLRRKETQVWSQVGVSGSISAVRRSLFRPIPPGTILDDVYWPMQVVLQGYRVIHDDRAHAYDRLPQRTSDEFRRKVRTLSGNFQLAALTPALLLPWRNPIWLAFVSHKLLRLLVPWALLGLLASNLLLPGLFYQTALYCQLAGYLLALLGLFGVGGGPGRLTSAAASVLVLNSAAWVAFGVWATGRAGRSWKKAKYQQEIGLLPSPRGGEGLGVRGNTESLQAHLPTLLVPHPQPLTREGRGEDLEDRCTSCSV